MICHTVASDVDKYFCDLFKMSLLLRFRKSNTQQLKTKAMEISKYSIEGSCLTAVVLAVVFYLVWLSYKWAWSWLIYTLNTPIGNNHGSPDDEAMQDSDTAPNPYRTSAPETPSDTNIIPPHINKPNTK